MSTVIERLEPALGATGEPSTRSPVDWSDVPWAGPALSLLLPVTAAIVWELSVAWGLIAGRWLPPPTKILATLEELYLSGELVRHLWATLWRVAVGAGLGFAAATLLAAVTGTFALVRRLLDPTLQALRAIPSIAWVPLFILWFGIFEMSKIMLIAVGAFFPVYLGLMAGIAGVDRKLVEVGRIYHLTPLALIGRILLPAAVPSWLTGVRSGLGLAWMFVIAAELMGASEGIGYLLLDGQMSGNAAIILAALLLFALLGKSTDWLLVRATRPLVAWRDSFGQEV